MTRDTLSNAFVEYATSGLETPLAYLMIAALVVATMHAMTSARRRTAVLVGLLAAAVVLTRFDLILLVAPMLVLLGIRYRRHIGMLVTSVLALFVPLIAWFGWSQLTYATWLPNTFEAKRNVDIPVSELAVQGVRYLWVSFEHDPVTFIALFAGVIGAVVLGSALLRTWAVGIALYLGYVVVIGGDFMAGRFLAVPTFVAVFLLALLGTGTSPDSDREREVDAMPVEPASLAAAFALVVLLGGSAAMAGSVPVSLSATQEPRWEVDQNYNAGVSDERGVYSEGGMTLRAYMNNLSLAFTNPDVAPLGDSSGLSRTLREIDKAATNWPIADGTFMLPAETGVFCGGLGYLGMATGPTVHLIDSCALTDRFLASAPFTPAEPFGWKPGHFHRAVPEGYEDAVRTNDPSKVRDMDEQFRLRELWARIRR